MLEQTLAQLRPHADWQDPIVIVGAGPVGMSAALGLSYYGVPCLVLDDAEGPATEGSRAIFMERHTLEILGMWSPVGQQMAELGMTLTGGRVFFRKTELYKTFSAPLDPDTPYPRFVNMPQNLLERLQYEALQKRPCCEIRWRHKVIGLTQNDDTICLEVQTPQGIEHVKAMYVLAADGPKSTMRHLLNLPFPGESRDHHFLILDVRMQLETPRERWFWFDPPFNPGRTALLHPQPDNVYRLDYQLPSETDLEAIKQPEALHKRIVATVGERPYEIVWTSIYTYQQRALEQFRHGRIFFVGDSAHLMSPFGGRGLNSGVQDVCNLLWKLLLVRAGLATDALLHSYHDERHAAAVENLYLTADTMNFLVPSSGFAQWKRDMILRLSLPFKFVRKHVNAGHMSSPSIYRHSLIVSEDPLLSSNNNTAERERAIYKRYRVGPCVGSLAPLGTLTDALTGEIAPLRDCFGDAFVVFYFCDDADRGLITLEGIRNRLPNLPIAFYLLTSQIPTQAISYGIHVLLDTEQAAMAKYNADSRTLYLMRPDRYIAARRFNSTLEELPKLLDLALGTM